MAETNDVQSEQLRAVIAAFERLGAAVILDRRGENWARALPDGAFEIAAQGLPNLVHELVHAQFLGRLEDDHGFDYSLVPLDLSLVDHRRHLFEELSACACSCMVVEASGREAWFAEQFEIQGVFHGLEGDPVLFEARVDHAIGKFGNEWRPLLFAAHRALGEVLDLPHPDLLAFWRRYRSRL